MMCFTLIALFGVSEKGRRPLSTVCCHATLVNEFTHTRRAQQLVRRASYKQKATTRAKYYFWQSDHLFVLRNRDWIYVCRYSDGVNNPSQEAASQVKCPRVTNTLTRNRTLFLVFSELQVMSLKAAPRRRKLINNALYVVENMSFWECII